MRFPSKAPPTAAGSQKESGVARTAAFAVRGSSHGGGDAFKVLPRCQRGRRVRCHGERPRTAKAAVRATCARPASWPGKKRQPAVAGRTPERLAKAYRPPSAPRARNLRRARRSFGIVVWRTRQEYDRYGNMPCAQNSNADGQCTQWALSASANRLAPRASLTTRLGTSPLMSLALPRVPTPGTRRGD